MKTNIYKYYSEFLTRENKEENGVSESFAKNYPKYEVMNESNKGCWNCSYCLSCSYCSSCSSCSSCRYCRSCRYCSSCSYCRSCSYCSDCSYCSSCSSCSSCRYCRSCRSCSSCSYCHYCRSCSDCIDCRNEKGDLIIPKIENIHQKILEAVNQPKALDMVHWHTCKTTHCRAGWAIVLAGKEGKDLEYKTSSLFAGMAIYNKSSDIKVSMHKFFDTNEAAMEDIKKCAELESKV